MKVVKQSASVIKGLSPMEHIERIGRICYKSEDKIAEGTAAKFVNAMYTSKHHAMLEHYRFIMEVSPVIYELLERVKHEYFEMTNTEYGGRQRFVISFSARGLINLVEDSDCVHHGVMPMAVAGVRDELIAHIIKMYNCHELFGWDKDKTIMLSTGAEFIANSPNVMNKTEWEHHGWRSIHCITDRGISHELVRHRVCSFAQESTRYCNYDKDKFGREITVIDQGFEEGSPEYHLWDAVCMMSEVYYASMIKSGVKPEMARSILPSCLKTEIIVTANIKEWNHIIDLRVYEITGKAHPLIKELLTPLVEYGVFDYCK